MIYKYNVQNLLSTYFVVFLFQKIEEPFLTAVKQTLGDRYTENIESIYKITIKLIIETLIEGYEKSGGS